MIQKAEIGRTNIVEPIKMKNMLTCDLNNQIGDQAYLSRIRCLVLSIRQLIVDSGAYYGVIFLPFLVSKPRGHSHYEYTKATEYDHIQIVIALFSFIFSTQAPIKSGDYSPDNWYSNAPSN